jgi:hypothetical protein
MKYVMLLGLKPVAWARRTQADRSRIKLEVNAWLEELKATASLVEVVRFETWKMARTVSMDSGVATDTAGPLLAGLPKVADAVLVACVVAEARSLKAALGLARGWPVPDAVVEVRPIDP